MSDKPNDGGPAFPFFVGSVDGAEKVHGMTLRDYFAAHALEEDIAAHQYDGSGKRVHSREAAKFFYADAMIAQREKE